MKKRNLISAAAMTVGVATVLAACSAGPGGAKDENTIVVDMWSGSAADTKAIEEQVKIARAQNPDLKIELRTSPWNDYFTKLTANMASGNMACVTAMNGGMLSGYTDGFVEFGDAEMKTAGLQQSDFAPGATEILSYGGKTYGLPFDVATMVTYYNADQLTAVGAELPTVGWTFDDFEAAAKKATTGGKFGFSVGLGETQWQALPIAMSGTQAVTADGKLQIGNSAFTDAAEWYAGLVTEQKVAAPVATASDTGWGENQFTAGNSAMAVDGTWNAVAYLTNSSGFKAGLAPMPSGEKGNLSLVLGSGFGVAKTCKNQDAALKVVGSLLSKDAQDYVASSGRSYPARAESQPLYFESIDSAYRDQVKAVFEEAFTDVEGQRITDNWAKVGTFVQPELVSVYSGQAQMRDVLESAQKQFAK